LTRINVRVMIVSTRGGINMLEVIKNVVESKTMVMVMIFIIGVSYVSATMNKNLEVSKESIVLQTQVN